MCRYDPCAFFKQQPNTVDNFVDESAFFLNQFSQSKVQNNLSSLEIQILINRTVAVSFELHIDACRQYVIIHSRVFFRPFYKSVIPTRLNMQTADIGKQLKTINRQNQFLKIETFESFKNLWHIISSYQ